MKLIMDNFYDDEVKDYLRIQEGVIKADVELKEPYYEVTIEHNDETTAEILLKHIQLFEHSKSPQIIEFDKDVDYEYKAVKYQIDDLCCEYCFKSLIYHLFKNENIKSVKSNYDLHEPLYDMEFILECNKDYSFDELTKYINEEL